MPISTQSPNLSVKWIRIGIAMHHKPIIIIGTIVAILVFFVLSHSQLKGIDRSSTPRSEIHPNNHAKPIAVKRVYQKPLTHIIDLATINADNQRYTNEIIAAYRNAPSVLM